MTYKDMANALNIDLWIVKEEIKSLTDTGILKHKKKRWTKKEEEFIAENLKEFTPEEFANILNVSVEQMRKKIYYLKKKLNRHKKVKKIDNEKVYKKLITQPRDKGIGDKKFDLILKVGQAYKITKKGLREGQIKVNEVFVGKFIQETEDCIFFKGKYYTESFLKKDYLMGEIEIREV